MIRSSALLFCLLACLPASAQEPTDLFEELLAEPVTLGFDEVSLAEAVDAIQEMVWLNLALGPGLDPGATVSLPERERTLGELLDALAAELELERAVWSGALVLHRRSAPLPAPSTHTLEGALTAYTLRLRGEAGVDALALLNDLAGVPLQVPPALAEQAARPVSLRVRNLPLGQVLDLLTLQLGLSWAPQGEGAVLAPPPPPAAQGDAADRMTRVRLTLQLVESPLDEALETLAGAGDVAIRVEAELAGAVTLQLRNATLQEAFDRLAEQSGLAWRLDGSTVVVYAPEPR